MSRLNNTIALTILIILGISISENRVNGAYTCLANPADVPPSVGATRAALFGQRLTAIGTFEQVVFSSNTSLATQMALLSAKFSDASITLPDTGTFGGPGNLEGLIEYGWIFNPNKNRGWAKSTTVSNTFCLDVAVEDNIVKIPINAIFTFQPYNNQIYTLPVSFTYTFYFKPNSDVVDHILLETRRDDTLRTGAAHLDLTNVCAAIMKNCVGANLQYNGSLWACVDYMVTLPTYRCANQLFKGNSFLCRYIHHFLTAFNPDVHCIHTAIASPVCLDSACGGEFFEYPLVCDKPKKEKKPKKTAH